MQICEQIIEKKNRKPIEFVVFFSHTVVLSKVTQKGAIFSNNLMKKNITTLRIRYAETDQMGVVYYGNYAQYFEQGRTEWLRNLGITYKLMEEKGVHLPVINLNINYKKPTYYDDVISITTTLKKIPTFKIEFDYQIHNQDNLLLATGSTDLVFVSIASRKLIKAPEYLIEKIIE